MGESSQEKVTRLFERYYPNHSRSGTAAFYEWVRQFTGRSTLMLNIGAGPPTNQPVRVFKGEVARVAAVDVDPIVLSNAETDDGHVYEPGGRFPFADDTFDLALSDYVLEHVEDPLAFLREVRRVLKPRGSFFFRTPNLYHYVSLVGRTTPHLFHRLIANRVRAMDSAAHEPWPTYYRLNSRAKIAKIARQADLEVAELRMYEPDPAYLKFHPLAFLAGVVYERTVNRIPALAGIRTNIFGRLIKP